MPSDSRILLRRIKSNTSINSTQDVRRILRPDQSYERVYVQLVQPAPERFSLDFCMIYSIANRGLEKCPLCAQLSPLR